MPDLEPILKILWSDSLSRTGNADRTGSRELLTWWRGLITPSYGKKKPEEMEKQREIFLNGTNDRGSVAC